MNERSFIKGDKMKKELIIETSIELLAQKGYFNTTTRMISEKANIAVGTIYTHFHNKESILDFIFQREYDKRAEYLDSLQEITCNHIEKFNLFLDFHFNELSQNQDLATVLIRESANPELQHLEGVEKFTHQLPNFFKIILNSALETGEIRELNTTFTAEIIFSTIRGTIFNIALRKEHQNFQDVKQELKNFITYAIKKN